LQNKKVKRVNKTTVLIDDNISNIGLLKSPTSPSNLIPANILSNKKVKKINKKKVMCGSLLVQQQVESL